MGAFSLIVVINLLNRLLDMNVLESAEKLKFFIHLSSALKSSLKTPSTKLKLIPNFITSSQEAKILSECEKRFKKLKYQRDHWDDAIVGFREFESSNWSADTLEIINRVKHEASFKNTPKQLVHVLDIEASGFIKPHVDSERYCGDKVASISLLSDSVMRLVNKTEADHHVTLFLPRLSLYVLSDEFRYDYTHEILKDDESYFGDDHVKRDRRISLVCRSEPSNRN